MNEQTRLPLPLEKVRNFGIIAHIDAGKTTTSERVLLYTGRIHKAGDIDDGTTTTDHMDQERERGITITAAAVTCFWRDFQLNLIDTPGHVDFTAEVERSLRVLDGGVVVFDGVAGVEPQSETVWHQADKYNVPRLAFVNKMDRMGADFFADLAAIRERLNKNSHPILLPMGAEANYKGEINLLTQKARFYLDEEGKTFEDREIPEEYKQMAQDYRAKLVEAVVEHDEKLLNQYLAGEPVSLADLMLTLRKATITNKIVPVLCGSALKNKGVQLVLDAVVDFLPSPIDVPPVEGTHPNNPDTKITRKTDDNEPFTGLAFKVATDPYVGKLCFVRVYSGILKAGSYVLNTTTGEKERIGRLVRMQADKRDDVQYIAAGDIAAAVGLKATFTGHTLTDLEHPVILESIKFPEPVISMAIEPKTKADQEKMGIAMQKLAEEDPTFKIHTDEETLQTIISGMGELHLEIIVDRMKREFKVETNVGKPQVAYKETIRKIAEAEGKYIRQSGGRGQYGHCWLRVEPQPRGTKFEFDDEIKGGIIPREYIPAIEKGVKEAITKGVLAGYPVVDIKVAVFDGSYHEVDSSEAAFKIAGSMAIQDGLRKAGVVLLEPVMKIEAITPENFMGEVIGNLNSKRAQIKEIRDRVGMKVIDGVVPLAEMFGYATELRSITQGRGSYSMEFSHYDEVPRNVVEKIVESHAKTVVRR